MRQTMAVGLEPKVPPQSTSLNQESSVPEAPKTQREAWLEKIAKGVDTASLSSEEFCKRQWIAETGQAPSEAVLHFMQSCKRNVQELRIARNAVRLFND